MREIRVVISAGGTGGHIYPAVAVLQALREASAQEGVALEVRYIGGNDMGVEVFRKEGVEARGVTSAKFHRHASWTLPLHAVGALAGVVRSLWELWRYMPDVVFSKGGYGAFPVLVASALYRIPIVLHESDSVPGLTNYLFGKFSRRVCISFPQAEKYFSPRVVEYTGTPERTGVLGGSREEGRRRFELTHELPVLFILGGSQGAQPLNDTIIEILPQLVARMYVLHQAGAANEELAALEAKEALRDSPYSARYRTFGLMEEAELRDAYEAADLVLARAGATSINEIALHGRPSVLIPLPHAGADHQRENAYAYAASGAALVLEEANLASNFLFERITALLADAKKLSEMGNRARQFPKPDAAGKIARILLSVNASS